MRRRRDRVRSLSPNRARDRRIEERARRDESSPVASRSAIPIDTVSGPAFARYGDSFHSISSDARIPSAKTRPPWRAFAASRSRTRPSEARGQIACAAALCDHVGQRSQRGVACRMTADVVDRFQVIEIGDEEPRAACATFGRA